MTTNQKDTNNQKPAKIGFGGWVGLLLLVGMIGSQCTESDKKTNNSSQQNIRQITCEEEHSPAFCRCFIGHITKSLSWSEELSWLGGNELTSASGRRALIEGYTLCQGL